MAVRLRLCVLFLSILLFVHCGYPPQGDEVQMGSVLLPATRRGRYLANIVRRQAVDGTGIKFNKDADRMNAEAKKKVDVLSEELLPYIIAEQERRTTLYKRVMTAIQNGEKGVTIAEIRNKPPLIIRKGLMYRCPANRAPKEPDGSGVIMCESEIEPTPVMYDSCLSAEDKELYVADSRYFFCNRHKVEGPDLPRNGSTVIGCAPLERTSLNYTTGKCALEDTDDVVVHYRYYPDKTYKFVTELDPDHEVCDHWNPCQIGYIYSLPSPDQAMPANELWHDYEPDEYEKDEIVPPIPEDNPEEYVPSDAEDEYATSPRKIVVPDGFKFHGIGRFSLQNIRTRVTVFGQVLKNYTNIKVKIEPPQGPPARRMSRKSRKKLRGRRKKTRRDDEPPAEGDTPAAEGETPAEGEAPTEAPAEAPAEGEAATEEHPTDAPEEAPAGETSETHEGAHEGSTEAPGAETAAPAPVETGFITIQFFFKPLTGEDMTHYYARFESKTQPGVFKYRTIVILHPATIPMRPRTLDVLPGQLMNATRISIKCGKCLLKTVMVRAFDGGISNLDTSRYRMRTENERKYIEIDLGKSKFQDFGDYFVVIQTEDGNEERIKALSINETSGSDITCSRQTKSVEAGTHVDHTVKYDCNDCLLEDVLCEGETVITSGRVSIVTASKFVSFNFPSFENENACVYIGLFQAGEKKYKRILSVVDNASPAVNLEKPPDVTPPPEGTQFEHEIPYSCEGECSIEKITLNGVPLEAVTRRSSAPLSGTAFYTYSPTTITLRITSFSSIFMGVYQALFNTGSGPVTKTILEIKDPNESSAEAATTAAPCSETAEPAASHAEEAPAQAEGETTAAAEAEASAATEGDAAVPAEGETPAPAEGEAPAPAEGETPAPAEGEAPAA